MLETFTDRALLVAVLVVAAVVVAIVYVQRSECGKGGDREFKQMAFGNYPAPMSPDIYAKCQMETPGSLFCAFQTNADATRRDANRIAGFGGGNFKHHESKEGAAQ